MGRGLILFVGTLILSSSSPLFCQPKTTSEKDFEEWFIQEVNLESLPIYKGTIYSLKPRSRSSHQFFVNKYFAYGSIKTTVGEFENLMFLYDIYDQVLILKHPDSSRFDGIQILMDKVRSFQIHGHNFIKVGEKGFLDRLYMGEKLSLYSKHSKSTDVKNNEVVFVSEQVYFLSQANELIPIENLRSLKDLYPDQYKYLKSFKRSNKLKISRNHDSDIILLIETLDKRLTK